MKIGPELVKSVGDVKIVHDKDYDSKAIRKGTCRSGSFSRIPQRTAELSRCRSTRVTIGIVTMWRISSSESNACGASPRIMTSSPKCFWTPSFCPPPLSGSTHFEVSNTPWLKLAACKTGGCLCLSGSRPSVTGVPDRPHRSRSFHLLGITPLTQQSHGYNDLNTKDASIACSFSHGLPRDSHPGGRFADAVLLP